MYKQMADKHMAHKHVVVMPIGMSGSMHLSWGKGTASLTSLSPLTTYIHSWF